MCLLIEKAKKDMDVVNTMQKINDEMYLDICCYHTQQAIEKLLKCSIELKGVTYEFTHSIITLYSQYVSVGWDEIEMLELMSGTITGWEASSRYKESFFATVKQLETAKGLYEILLNRLLEYLNEGIKTIK
ncbi:MAG: HEPN domain-containing protein [Roseburia sp.]|nr:HEPN domain-containing protein [Roseburia sp. 831b]MCI5918349.1 HEPN domain-containing protein [Roseburia sp.]MDD6216781.1 HEPN domain-containing protein [Roseburia sp.]MDY5884271.1 HEPN domain-containing protein [Roseburia sp.]